MKAPNVTTLKKYLSALTKIKKKYVTAERLSKVVGIYPEIINENLSFFDPMVNMDYEYNLMDLVPQIQKFIDDTEAEKAKAKDKKQTLYQAPIRKTDFSKYEGIGDFIYQKMTIGGMLDKYFVLTDNDLKVLKKLIVEEQQLRKKKK